MTVMQEMRRARAWVAPGPGSWANDDSHLVGTMPPYQAALFPAAVGVGFSQGFRRYGMPLERIAMAVVGYRLYSQARPVGAPARAGSGPPPAFLFKLLFLLHPELRYRRRQAVTTFAIRRWRGDAERWYAQVAPRLRAANGALQAVDPGSLDDAGLRAHLATANARFSDGVALHFAAIPGIGIPVGEWLARTRDWTGAGPAELLAALRGTSTASTGPAALLEQLAAAIRPEPAALAVLRGVAGDARERLGALRASAPAVAAALDGYLAEHGWRLATGLTLADRTLMEMPEVLLHTIVASLDRPPGDPRPAADAAAARLRERVPAAARPAYDDLLAEARLVFGLRDDNVGLAELWPMGLVRRALLAAGQRLAARGAVCAPDHLLEATPDEVAALLGGPGVAPSAAELEARAADRRAAAAEPVPATLGPPAAGGPPPIQLFPPEMQRLMRATQTYSALVGDEKGSNGPPERAGLGGQAASAGRYRGRARVILSPDDFAKIGAGDVLVARTTSPAYNILLPLLGAVITDRGGALCHAALVAREFGIPAVVGTRTATTTIPDGAWVVVDGTQGTVEIEP
ncbi:MAG TPA: PEP-utilizing enzyme [Chloroflexia bacterium]|nr:PEP-utilizing enzyme [Chloroflexia bacterium]